MKFDVSIRKMATEYSVDIRPIDKDGITAPCGDCRLFRFIGDALIWIAECSGKDIPAAWPDLENRDWSNDFRATISIEMQETAFDRQLEASRAQRLLNDFARLDAQSAECALAKMQPNEFPID
jgi:hypothetical protein